MNSIEKLIAQHCPNGVEYIELKEVAKIKNGKDYKHLSDGQIPVYGSGGIMTYVDSSFYELPSVLIPRKGSLGKLYYVDTPFWTVDTIFYTEINTSRINAKFFFYFLKTKKLETLNNAGGVPSLTQAILNPILVPVPPLLVQEEIVRILDKFTALEAELEAELEARRKQYEYYRNKLLSFNSLNDDIGGGSLTVNWLRIDNVCCSVNKIKWERSTQTLHYIDLSSVSRNNNSIVNTVLINSKTAPSRAQQIIYEGDVIVGTTRPTLKRVAYIEKYYHQQICSTGFCVLRSNPQFVNSRYLYHTVQTKRFYAYIEQKQEGAGYPIIQNKTLKQYSIPIPPLAEQERIVTILDRFERLVNDISDGLPAELAARRAQYEHYRNKLLSFEPNHVS